MVTGMARHNQPQKPNDPDKDGQGDGPPPKAPDPGKHGKK